MIVGCPSCVVVVVRRQQLLQTTSPPKLLAGSLYDPPLKLFNGFGSKHIWVTQAKMYFQDENFKKSFL